MVSATALMICERGPELICALAPEKMHNKKIKNMLLFNFTRLEYPAGYIQIKGTI
jgi:hypothetical protein